MALKFKLETKDEIPAELVNLYVERDGAWLLDVESLFGGYGREASGQRNRAAKSAGGTLIRHNRLNTE